MNFNSNDLLPFRYSLDSYVNLTFPLRDELRGSRGRIQNNMPLSMCNSQPEVMARSPRGWQFEIEGLEMEDNKRVQEKAATCPACSLL